MDKNIRFHRNLYLAWLDAAAAICTETDDRSTVRARLDPIVAQQIASSKARDMTLDMLINIWVKTGDSHPALRQEAQRLFDQTEVVTDRLWLHYGLTLLAYDFFRRGVVIIGQISQYADEITPREIKARLAAELGPIGALDMATDRLMFSLRNWGVLEASGRVGVYLPRRQQLRASDRVIERWMLATAMAAHPAQEIPFADLVRLPELFPFRFTLTVDDLRVAPGFEVHRQGGGWDMVMATRRDPAPLV